MRIENHATTVADAEITPAEAYRELMRRLGETVAILTADNDDTVGVVEPAPDSAPESDFESEICAGEKGPQREHLAALGNMVRYAEALDARGFDWSELTGVSLPPDIAALRVQIMFASGMFAKHWYEATISYGALVWLTQQRIAGPKDRIKDARGIVLSVTNFDDEVPWMRRRRKEKCVAINGLSFDADGYPTREMVQPTCLLIAYSTSNDGKDSEKLSRDTYKGAPTPEAIRHHFGDAKARAYKNLRVGVNDEGLGLSFDKQQRTRYLAAFKRPLEGGLLDQLIERSLFDKFAAAVEEEALGITGTDTKCFEPVRVAYLGIEPQYDAPAYNEVIGPHELFDPVPTAERILAENPPRERKEYSGEIRDGEVPPHLRESLKGVLLASLIAEQYEELVRNENNVDPLVLHRCPFADEHGSKTGVSDGSAYVYDAGEEYAYPRVKCHHETCKNRKTEEFVAAMIEAGEIEREDVFENADYRLQYEEQPITTEVRVVDKNGDGLDCAKYVAKTGDDRTASELAEAIRGGDVTAGQLIDVALAAEVPDVDPYRAALRALAIESPTLMPTDVDDRVGELVRLHNKSGVRAVRGDLKSTVVAIEARKRELGLLSKSETKRASRVEDTEPQTPPDSEVADFATWEELVYAAHALGRTLRWLDDLDGYVLYKPGGNNGAVIPYLVSSPIRIRGRGRIGSDTTPHLALDVLQTDGEWTRCIVDLAGLSKDPTGQLRALGIRSANYVELSGLLANITGGESLRIVDQPGRCGDSYVLPNGEIIGEAIVYPTFSASAEYGTLGYDVGGTVQGANDLMASIEGQHRTQVLAALSLSAEVAADMGVEMGGLNLLAGSSGGKTTSLCVATSTRAMGATGKTDKRGAVRSANVTSFAASLIAARLTGGVLTADEIKECDPETLERLVYEVPNGAPKAAGKSSGDLRKALSWSVCLMMTGEMTVKQHLEAKGLQHYAGQAVRIVDIPADAGKGLGVFEFVPEGFDDIASYANWLNDMARTHYGHHTRALLREYLRDVEGYQRDARAAAQRVVLDTGDNAQVARVARRWQTMIGIAIVAAERGIAPWTAESLIKATQVCFRAWIDLRGGTADGEALAADAAFTSAVFRDPGRFDDDQISSLRADRGRLGVRAYVAGHVEYWIPGETELAELVGGQMGRVKPWLDYLVADKSERWTLVVPADDRRKRQSRRLGGARGYCIRSRHPRDQWGEDDGHSDVM